MAQEPQGAYEKLNMTALMAICISVDRGILVLLCAVWKQRSLDSGSGDLKQDGVAARSHSLAPGPAAADCCGEMSRAQQEGLALRKLLLGIRTTLR